VLVKRARAGSDEAFAEIVRRYERPLQSYCARRLDTALAKDAVQQTFLRALRAMRRPDAERELILRPWLYRIAHRCAIDMQRQTRGEHLELDPSFDGVPQPPQIFEQQQRLRDTVAAVQKLPASQRRALVAREFEGRSYEEISAELGHSDAGVRQLIFRARSALRNGLGAILPLWRLPGWSGGGGNPALATTSSLHDLLLLRGAALLLSAGCVTLCTAGADPAPPAGESSARPSLNRAGRNQLAPVIQAEPAAVRVALPGTKLAGLGAAHRRRAPQAPGLRLPPLPRGGPSNFGPTTAAPSPRVPSSRQVADPFDSGRGMAATGTESQGDTSAGTTSDGATPAGAASGGATSATAPAQASTPPPVAGPSAPPAATGTVAPTTTGDGTTATTSSPPPAPNTHGGGPPPGHGGGPPPGHGGGPPAGHGGGPPPGHGPGSTQSVPPAHQ
jgi:RNA polymerase sigma factor (sigma-70 family)